MELRYDEDFIEAAVFVCASGQRKGVPPLQICAHAMPGPVENVPPPFHRDALSLVSARRREPRGLPTETSACPNVARHVHKVFEVGIRAGMACPAGHIIY